MTTIEKQKRGRWKLGESGNPNGRKPGTGKVAQLRESIAQHLPAIIQQLVTQAKESLIKSFISVLLTKLSAK